jgi:hypothetical protein
LDNYEKMEREKTKLFITKESQKVKAKGISYKRILFFTFILEAETEKILEKIKAETASAVAQVDMEQQILQREGHQKLAEIESKLFL